MKLESLNNSKYSLTPEKMGELVGGRISYSETGGVGKHSCDACYHYTYSDSWDRNQLIDQTFYFDGQNDTTVRNNFVKTYDPASATGK